MGREEGRELSSEVMQAMASLIESGNWLLPVPYCNFSELNQSGIEGCGAF